ncbi:hypothetical protein C0J52_16881 [Blattella germanica]|nr:hypothetical protein C0J52_16881 [Blattella germanica]
MITVFVSIISFFFMMGYILGYLTTTLAHQKRNTYLYRSNSAIAKCYMLFHRVSEELQQKVEHFYEEFSKRKEDLEEVDFQEILPLGFVKDIKVDMYWAVFKHTHIFRNMDMAFLQVLALKLRYKFFMPGDIIFNSKGYKRQMIYVIAGHIQVSQS